jgi:sugar phosphate isomerase/epimerase
MNEPAFALSAFGDEIADDLDRQLQILRELRIEHLDLRSAWKTNVLKMSDEMVEAVARDCARADVQVACIAGPIGKSSILEPPEKEEANLERLFTVAGRLGTHRIRIFSFYPPPGTPQSAYGGFVEEAATRLARLAHKASSAGVLLLLENEKDIVGDTIERSAALLRSAAGPSLRFLWDPANFVQVGEAHPTTDGWDLLGPYLSYVHIKDARFPDGAVVAAGEGDGEVRKLLVTLEASGYRGFLSLEPHLLVAGQAGGFTGETGMRHAAASLRRLMSETRCLESAL